MRRASSVVVPGRSPATDPNPLADPGRAGSRGWPPARRPRAANTPQAGPGRPGRPGVNRIARFPSSSGRFLGAGMVPHPSMDSDPPPHPGRSTSIVQWPWAQEATASGRASVMGREQNRVDHLDVLPPPDGSGAADPDHLGGAGEVDPGGGLDGLDGAPHPPPVAGVDARDGRDVLPGQLLERLAQGLLVRLDREHVVGAATADPLGRAGLGAPWRRRPHRPGPGGRAGPSARGSRWTCRPPASGSGPCRRPGPGPPGGGGPGCHRCGPRAWSHPPRRSPCGRRWCRCGCTTRRSGGRRGRPGPGPSGPCGWSTPMAGPAPPPGPGPQGRPVPGRRRAPISPSGSGTPPVSPSRPGTGPRAGGGEPRAGPWGLSRPPGSPSGAGATGRLWWMMTWRCDPPAARLIQALPIVPAGPRRTRTNTPTTPDIRPPPTDFADPLQTPPGRARAPPRSGYTHHAHPTHRQAPSTTFVSLLGLAHGCRLGV